MSKEITREENGKLLISGRKKKQKDIKPSTVQENINNDDNKLSEKIELLKAKQLPEEKPIIKEKNMNTDKIEDAKVEEEVRATKEYSPFNEAPIIRDSGLGGNQADNTQPLSQEKEIPEPDITPDDDSPASVGGSNSGGVNGEQTKDTDNAVGDGTQPADGGNADTISGGSPMTTETLSDADRHNAAKAGAVEAVNLYCTYKPMIFTHFAKPSEKKIKALIKKGELNPNIMIETADCTATFKEHIETINEACEDAYAPSEEFRERIIPPLTRIFEKHNMGLTDEQQVLAIVGQDLLTSSIQLYQIKGMQKELLEHACDITKQLEVNTAEKNKEIRQKDNELQQKDDELDKMRKRYDAMLQENERLKTAKEKTIIKPKVETKVETKKLEPIVSAIDEGDVPSVEDKMQK